MYKHKSCLYTRLYININNLKNKPECVRRKDSSSSTDSSNERILSSILGVGIAGHSAVAYWRIHSTQEMKWWYGSKICRNKGAVLLFSNSSSWMASSFRYDRNS